MSEAVCRAIAGARSGFVEAPAGCGKTEAIVNAVGAFCEGQQLVLTHTNAGVQALRQRFRDNDVPTNKYHVDTIAGWSWSWVRRYPQNSHYAGALTLADWDSVYPAMTTLLEREFVRSGILNSYEGVIVDEYQDCTFHMHELISQLNRYLPCRVLGDELQGVFDFSGHDLVQWSAVRADFGNDLGALGTPHRWIRAGNERLGSWLLGSRSDFQNNREPGYRASPIDHRNVAYRDLMANLLPLLHDRPGRTCIIGPKARPLAANIQSSLIKHGCRILEPSDLRELKKLVLCLSVGSTSDKVKASHQFLAKAHSGLQSEEKMFLEKLLKGTTRSLKRPERRALASRHASGYTAQLLLDILGYLEGIRDVRCKLVESTSALKCILEKHLESGESMDVLYTEEVARRRFHDRSKSYRCAGSTLLVKGLEFDHVIVLRDSSRWQENWGTHRDLYVALTRGSKSVALFDLVGATA